MASTEGKYGVITAENKTFHPDEPVFLLRATDKLTVEAVMGYWERCKAAGCSKNHCAAILGHAERILRWQHAHPDLVRLPD